MAGFLINSRGTTMMLDPLLGGFDMPMMIEFPIAAADVPRLDNFHLPTTDEFSAAVDTLVVLNRDHHAELSAWFIETFARFRDATQAVRRTMAIK
jgi:hypothetical protein